MIITALMTLLAAGQARADTWIGLEAGAATHQLNDTSNFPPTDPRHDQLSNAVTPMGGVSLGMSGWQLLFTKFRIEAHYLMTPTTVTTNGVGEFTGNVQQKNFGLEVGFTLGDYVFVTFGPFPWLNPLETSGTKIFPYPGRTTDEGRTWDGGLTMSAGIDIPLGRSFSVGAIFRGYAVVPGTFGPDSSGYAWSQTYFAATLRAWFR
jgi:hypothetical protein